MSTCSKLAYVALFLSAGPALAQRPDNVITVMTFRIKPESEKEVGAQAAASLRDRIENDFSSRQLTVRKTEQVLDYLDQSGFLDETKIPDALDANNEALLAKGLSADLWITGDIVDNNGNYRISPKLILTRDPRLQQPLPVQASDNIDDAMKNVSRSLRDAVRQLEGERKCIGNYNARKPKDAIAAANSAISAYPNATIARLCLQSIYFDLYTNAKTKTDSAAYADSTLAVAAQVLKIDSLNPLALQTSVPLYKARGDTARWLSSVMRLAQTSPPGDTKTLQDVINELAGAGRFAEAQQLVQTLLDKSSGDPAALRLAFLVYGGAGNWKAITTTGPLLVQSDSAIADSTQYYLTMAVAYDSLHQPAQATELLAEGTSRVPRSGALWYLYSQALKQQGQLQQAQVALGNAVKYDSSFAKLLFQPVLDFFTAKQYDSTYAALTRAVANGADNATAGQYALGFASQLLQEGSPSKDRPLMEQTIKFAMLSNRLTPSSKAQYVTGVAGYTLMDVAVHNAEKSKSCTDTQMADAAYKIAQPAIAEAAKVQEASSAQLLEVFPQYRSAIDSQLKHFCK